MPVTDPEKKTDCAKGTTSHENLLYMRSTKPNECNKMQEVSQRLSATEK